MFSPSNTQLKTPESSILMILWCNCLSCFSSGIVTSKGINVDFVSRFFAPKIGINEDPVTGSAHTLLIPFWAEKLNKTKLEAMQLSKRTGYLRCENLNNRVEMSGQAITYLKGILTI